VAGRRGEADLKTILLVGLVAVVLCCGGGVGGGWAGIQRYFHGHPVSEQVLSAISESAEAQAALGRPVSIGWTTVGQIQTTGVAYEATGRADLRIPVSGPLGSGRVRVVSVLDRGAWSPVVMRLQAGDLDLDLLEAATDAAVAARAGDVADVMTRAEDAAGKGRFDDAVAACKEVLELERDDATVWSRCGRIAYDAGDLPRAERYLKRALAMDDTDNEARYDLGRVLARTARFQLCVDTFTALLQQEPVHADGWFHRSACYAELGESRKARAGAREACNMGSSEGCELARKLD
jgi:hypothetical protein